MGLYLHANSKAKNSILPSCSFVLILFPSGFKVLIFIDPGKADEALILFFLQFYTLETYSHLWVACYNNSLLQLPEVKCLASVYLSAWLSLALSLHVRLQVYRDMSALMDCKYTQGAVGWVTAGGGKVRLTYRGRIDKNGTEKPLKTEKPFN